MGKSLYIAEKPSVAQEFAKALKINTKRYDGYLESEEAVVTWCVGHLVTMSYPEVYDPALKRWSLETLPFLPQEWKYEVIPSVSKQFQIVKGLLNRADVETIYVCTDSGREGEYIYRLVEQMAEVKVPSLILQCSDDLLAPPHIGTYTQEKMPDATLVQLRATGHLPHVSAPAETAAAILSYLSRTPA